MDELKLLLGLLLSGEYAIIWRKKDREGIKRRKVFCTYTLK
jgi:hypothetical protein